MGSLLLMQGFEDRSSSFRVNTILSKRIRDEPAAICIIVSPKFRVRVGHVYIPLCCMNCAAFLHSLIEARTDLLFHKSIRHEMSAHQPPVSACPSPYTACWRIRLTVTNCLELDRSSNHTCQHSSCHTTKRDTALQETGTRLSSTLPDSAHKRHRAVPNSLENPNIGTVMQDSISNGGSSTKFQPGRDIVMEAARHSLAKT